MKDKWIAAQLPRAPVEVNWQGIAASLGVPVEKVRSMPLVCPSCEETIGETVELSLEKQEASLPPARTIVHLRTGWFRRLVSWLFVWWR